MLSGRRDAACSGKKPAWSILRICYRVVSWGSLTLLVIAIFLIFHKTPPPAVTRDLQAAGRVETKLRASEAAAGQPHQLRLDESEVNAYLGSNLALRQDPAAGNNAASTPTEAEPSLADVQSSVKDVRINLVDDRVQAYLVFDFHGKDLSLLLEGKLHVEDGYLRFQPTSGKLGSLPIPQSTLESAVQRLFSSAENKDKLRVPAEIGDIRIQNGDLVVSYRQ